MSTVVKTRIVRIGNSQGVRIPKLLLEQVDLGEDVGLVLQENQIVIRPAFAIRHGWEEAFREMARAADVNARSTIPNASGVSLSGEGRAGSAGPDSKH